LAYSHEPFITASIINLFNWSDILTVEQAINVVSKSYGAFHISFLSFIAILSGWIVLAIGCYLSGTLNVARSVALAMMSLLMIGVLKGSSVMSIVYVTGLCVAFVPLGVKVLLEGPIAKPRVILLIYSSWRYIATPGAHVFSWPGRIT
jgi:hypothetical protein